MTNDEFCYWITGYLELTDEDVLSAKQISIIQNHVNLVHAMVGNLRSDITLLSKVLKERSQSFPVANIRKIFNYQ